MIKVNYNNWIIVTKNDPNYDAIQDILTVIEKEFQPKKQWDNQLRRLKQVNLTTNVVKTLYELDDEQNLLVPFGLLKYIRHLFSGSKVENCTDNKHPLYKSQDIVDNIERYRDVLPGISLYDNQLECVKRIFMYHRGVIQAPTGFGKTEIMCAAVQIMKELNGGKYPTVLILEPTIELLNGIKARFKKYRIPVSDYRQTRMISTGKVNLAHPKSLMSDLEKDKRALSKVVVQFMDEAHHSQSISWSTPSNHMPNLIYSIGLSATFLSHYHIDGTTIFDFSYNELKRIGACGPLIMKVNGKDLINNNQLAKPKLIVLHNPANEEIDERILDYVWNNVRKIRLQSEARTRLIAKAASIFAKYDRKVIILMNNLEWGRQILREIYNLGYGDIARTCYGGQVYERVNRRNGKIEKEWNNVLQMFDKERIKIIVGSSCIQEGIDLSKVDVCILAQGGKTDRTSLQSVGRALRKSKTGKYAYIVDFDDYEDRILTNQFVERMKKYKKVLGISKSEDIVLKASISDMVNAFKRWEEIE